LRVEGVRRLVRAGLAGELAPAPAAPSEDTAELRSRLIALAGKLDQFVAYTKQVEAERDALAARAERAARLEVVSSPDRPRKPFGRDDPEAAARARAQLVEAEARAAARAEGETEAERRRRDEIDAPRD
jgi:hypothetical protein